MTTRKLDIRDSFGRKRTALAKEWGISLQPQGYDWTLQSDSTAQIVYDNSNSTTSDNELIKVTEKDNRTVLIIYSDDPVVEMHINNVMELESKIVNRAETREHIEIDKRKLKIQNALSEYLEIIVEPEEWGSNIIPGSIMEIIYNISDILRPDLIQIGNFSKGETSISIWSDQTVDKVFLDGELW